MFIPIVMGVLLSYALEPVVAWMERWHIPRAGGRRRADRPDHVEDFHALGELLGE